MGVTDEPARHGGAVSTAAYTAALRTAGRRGEDPVRVADEFLARVTDPGQLLVLLEDVMATGSPDARDLLVFAARRAPEPAGAFLKQVVGDPSQPASVRRSAAESLAQREQDGWEELIADVLLTRGRNANQRLDGALVLAKYGTGGEAGQMLEYLRYALSRPKRQNAWPSPVTAACVYFMKGDAVQPPPGFTQLVVERWGTLRDSEAQWLAAYLPGASSEPTPEWDETASAWAQANPRVAITDLPPGGRG